MQLALHFYTIFINLEFTFSNLTYLLRIYCFDTLSKNYTLIQQSYCMLICS